MENQINRLVRIGIFYDGGFFSEVTNYYKFYHQRRSNISVPGLHQFVKERVAQEDGVDSRRCLMVDAHYFRGRFSAEESQEKDLLFLERKLDDILMRCGVATHYLPRTTREIGIDVWLALEAYELAAYKRFDILVLVAGDGDYLPLMRKLRTLGIRVMILAWDLVYQDKFGQQVFVRTSPMLAEEATYVVNMEREIDQSLDRNDQGIEELFGGKR